MGVLYTLLGVKVFDLMCRSKFGERGSWMMREERRIWCVKARGTTRWACDVRYWDGWDIRFPTRERCLLPPDILNISHTGAQSHLLQSYEYNWMIWTWHFSMSSVLLLNDHEVLRAPIAPMCLELSLGHKKWSGPSLGNLSLLPRTHMSHSSYLALSDDMIWKALTWDLIYWNLGGFCKNFLHLLVVFS